MAPVSTIHCAGGRRLEIGRRALILGILNVTPDSFSDGGRYRDRQAAVERALAMIEEGADLIDIGGESTRPGAAPVSEAEELERVAPVIEALSARAETPISVDTRKAAVAEAALTAGAALVNDVSALGDDPGMAGVCARFGAGVILMHMRGQPATMQADPRYDDVVLEVREALLTAAARAQAAGIARESILLDPGFGFGKTFAHNAALLRGLEGLAAAGYPLVVGVSRKAMIGQAEGLPVAERLAGSLAAAVLAYERGAAVLRVHDVGATRRALAVAASLLDEAAHPAGTERTP